MEGKKLWEIIFNTDLEEPVLSHLGLKKDFDDMGTDEENADIIAALEGKTKGDVLDWYLLYNGHGIYASDIKYLLIEQLDIQSLDEIEEWGY